MPITTTYPSPFIKDPRKEPKARVARKEENYVVVDDEDDKEREGSPRGSEESSSDSSNSSSSSDESSLGSDDSSLSNDNREARRARRREKERRDEEEMDAQGDSPRNFEDDDDVNRQTNRYKQREMLVVNDLDDEPEETKRRANKPRSEFTLWDMIVKIRQDLARSRRNKGLRFHERRFLEEQEEEKKAKRLEKLKSKWKASCITMKMTKMGQAKSMLDNIRRTAKTRHLRDISERDRRHTGLTYMLDRFLEWDMDSMRRQEVESQDKKQVVQKGEKERRDAARQAEEQENLALRTEEIATSQQVMKMVRQSGVCAAVNPPPTEEEELPMETDKVVTIRPRSGAVLVITKVVRPGDPPPHVTYFNIDLLRFRAVERIRGERLGATGGVALAQDLVLDNCCLKLQVLDLRGCKIGRVGLEALGETFATVGTKVLVHTLNLRHNDLTGRSMVHFGKCLQRGGLPYLTTLDLQGNLLGDHGAAAIASFLLANAAPRVENLYLQRNEIGDQGALSLYRVAVSAERWCPRLKAVHARQNKVTKKAYQQMPRCPAILDI